MDRQTPRHTDRHVTLYSRMYLKLLQVLGHFSLALLQPEDIGLSVGESRVKDVNMSPMFLNSFSLSRQLYVLPVLGGHQLLVLAHQLVDQAVLPHDLPPQDGVKTGNVAGVGGHHLHK